MSRQILFIMFSRKLGRWYSLRGHSLLLMRSGFRWWQAQVLRKMPRSRPCKRHSPKMAQTSSVDYRNDHGIPCGLPRDFAMVGSWNRHDIGRYRLWLFLVLDLLCFLQAMCLCLRMDPQHCNTIPSCDVVLPKTDAWTGWIHFRLLDTLLRWRRMLLEVGSRLLVCQKDKRQRPFDLHWFGLAHP